MEYTNHTTLHKNSIACRRRKIKMLIQKTFGIAMLIFSIWIIDITKDATASIFLTLMSLAIITSKEYCLYFLAEKSEEE